MRIAVYSGHAYQRAAGRVYADRAFVLFLGHLAAAVDGVMLLGRLDPGNDRARYQLPAPLGFVPLPHYKSLGNPLQAVGAMARSMRQAWRALADTDVVWVLGPHPFGFPLIAMAVLRGRRVVLGVRQDTLAYVRTRHPGRYWVIVAGTLLEGGWRALSRVFPTVAVGPELAARYRRSRRVHELTVSLVPEAQVVTPEQAGQPRQEGEATILSVGRLEEEKNPLMLADVLAELHARAPSRYRLVVCGEGPLAAALRARIAELGLTEQVELHGYVPFGEMLERYRSADALLSTSWTEGFPQVFVEAFAAGLPVVATDVGGIRSAVGKAVVLVPPGDSQAAADALERVIGGSGFRSELSAAGLEWVAKHTTESEVARLAGFLAGRSMPGRVA